MLKLRLLLSILILAGLAVIGYSRSQEAKADTTESHCATLNEPDEFVMVDGERVMNSKVVDRKCFESEVEVLRYFSDGAIDLPEDASRQEIEDAMDAHYQSQLASDDYPE